MASNGLMAFLRKLEISRRPLFLRYGSTGVYDEAKSVARKGVDAAKQGGEAANRTAQQIKNDVSTAADDAVQKAKAMGGKVTDAANDIAGKAKQTAEEAKDTIRNNLNN